MGRGVSTQQQDLLRAALAVNEATADACKVDPETLTTATWYTNLHPKGQPALTALYQGYPDLHNQYAYWLVLHIPYHRDDGRVIPAPAQAASIKRALSRLCARGLLVRQRYLNTYQGREYQAGYLLTEAGIQQAKLYPPMHCTNLDFITSKLGYYDCRDKSLRKPWANNYPEVVEPDIMQA